MGVERIGTNVNPEESRALRRFDRNNDGHLSVTEIRQQLAAWADINQDGQITEQEVNTLLDDLGVQDPQLRDELKATLTQPGVGFGHDLAPCNFNKEAVCVNFIDKEP